MENKEREFKYISPGVEKVIEDHVKGTRKKLFKLIFGVAVQIAAFVWIGLTYGWETSFAIFVWFWGFEIERNAKK